MNTLLILSAFWSVQFADVVKLPGSKLIPALANPDICQLRYRISTDSEECQKCFDQGLAYLYSYVWMESARSFETATRHDPDCAIAWLGLHRSLTQWTAGMNRADAALKKAYELIDKASHSEKQLILARAQEKGIAKDAPKDAEARRKLAQKTLDDLLALHPDDEEAWFARAQLANQNKFFGGDFNSAPFYLMLCKINPVHPGANHELLHHYENIKRPALGWAHSEKYIESSPGIPHPWHMQGHLATRLGRWRNATEGSIKACEIERKYHENCSVKPSEDHQYGHHLQILLRCLIHDGRFAEARAVKEEGIKLKYEGDHAFHWGRLHLAERDYSALATVIETLKGKNKNQAYYLAALGYLAQGDLKKARTEIELLETAYSKHPADNTLLWQTLELRGKVLCKTGLIDEGLAMLKRAVDGTKNDYAVHAWGHGSYFMEQWGLAALEAGRDADAEEAFLESLAHDKGSLIGALGMMALCEKRNQPTEAQRYKVMAKESWRYASDTAFNHEVAEITKAKIALK